ncbi:hypothetical protein NL676_014007 [Syzygium grande]|nr:hypothetical protein NL676_014007 [Syzygium grande]
MNSVKSEVFLLNPIESETSTLDGKTLNRLDQLGVLSLKDNSIFGNVPNLSSLVNLKSLYLNGNAFSGSFPTSLTGLHCLKILVLLGNYISGRILGSQ